jgi:hypothetical protein
MKRRDAAARVLERFPILASHRQRADAVEQDANGDAGATALCGRRRHLGGDAALGVEVFRPRDARAPRTAASVAGKI